MSGLSKLGVVQVQGGALAENLKITAAQVHQYEPGLQKALTVIDKSVGDSHQDDVAQLREVVLASYKANELCATTLATCARHIRELVDAT